MNEIIDFQNSTAISRTQDPKTPTQELGKNDFLNLLMAQMSSQDPMNPMDNQAFIEQLTSFSNLEQLTNLGDKLDSLLQVTASSNAANAVSLLNRDVRVSGSNFKGPEGNLFYKLPERAHDVKLVVRHPDGKIVKVLENLPVGEGLHGVAVDGLEPNKDYKFTMECKNAEGKEIKTELSVMEFVEGVNFQQGIPVLLTQSGREVSAADVVEIRKNTNLGSAAASNQSAPVSAPTAPELPNVSSDEGSS